ncbi:MAG: tetratricopeptide repeat protein, partial [Opitutaceae bacterium]
AFLSGSFREAFRRRWRLHLALMGTWLPLAWLMRGIGQRDVGFGTGIPWWVYALTEARAVLGYLKLSVWPSPLILFRNPVFLTRVAPALPYVFALLALVVVAVLAAVRRPRIGFALLAPFIILAPTSTIVPILNQPMGEHRMYLPLAALAAAFAAGACAILGRRSLVLCAGLAAILGTAAWRRNAQYRTELSIWQDNMAKDPENSFAENDLGSAYLDLHDYAKAVACCERAVRLDPLNQNAHDNLGYAYSLEKRYADAVREFRAALRVRPDFPEAMANLGGNLSLMGKFHEALGPCLAAVRMAPDNERAHNNLGHVYDALGRSSAALAQFEEAVALDPTFADAESNVGAMLTKMGRPAEALPHCRRAVALNPGLAKAWSNLGAAEQALGLPKGLADSRRAVSLDPSDDQGRIDLAEALAHARHWAEAARQYATLTSHPGASAAVWYDYGVTLDALRQRAAAIPVYERALALEPRLVEAHTNLASDLLSVAGRTRLPEALLHLREAVRLRPDSAEAHRNLAVGLSFSGNLAAALREDREAVRLDPADAAARRDLANLAQRLRVR